MFDQTLVDGDTQQVLKIDEDKFADDNDMLYVLHKLTAAAANSEMRQDMNVEDEYYKAIEDRDTAIMQRDKMLKERDCKMAQMDERLSQQSEQLSQQSEQLRNMAKALFVNGLSVEQISNMTGIDIDIIAKFLG